MYIKLTKRNNKQLGQGFLTMRHLFFSTSSSFSFGFMETINFLEFLSANTTPTLTLCKHKDSMLMKYKSKDICLYKTCHPNLTNKG